MGNTKFVKPAIVLPRRYKLDTSLPAPDCPRPSYKQQSARSNIYSIYHRRRLRKIRSKSWAQKAGCEHGCVASRTWADLGKPACISRRSETNHPAVWPVGGEEMCQDSARGLLLVGKRHDGRGKDYEATQRSRDRLGRCSERTRCCSHIQSLSLKI